MNRRGISTALLAMAALPHVAEAQKPGRVYRIGWLGAEAPGGSVVPFRPEWRQLMAKRGWVLDKNVVVIYRYTDRMEQLPELADELVRLNVDVIVAFAAPQTEAARQATKTIPIVFFVHGDPVGRGHIASLARPGGNITGYCQMLPELCVKRMQLLRELLPGASRVAVLWNVANPTKMADWKASQDAARDLALKLDSCEFTGPDDFQAALEVARKARPDALMPLEDSLTYRFRNSIIEFAARERLPAVYGGPLAEFGGLLCYHLDVDEVYRLNAYYLDKILKGAKPADLPVAQPTSFTLSVNLKTARALDLTIPRSILTRAEIVVD
ncbi:ABC transporter substrate-binding protein [Variovorax humicola]|uniref:ABC transporter substrate-binding protein n=1 Tax=Variovorax humicola TaxID=1769758 RepID=A0ABU8W6X0_9BURK